MSELAEMMGVTSSFIGSIENGRRGTTAFTCYKLSEIFDISVGDLFACDEYDKDKLRPARVNHNRNEIETKRDEISELLSDVDNDTYEFVIACIKSLRKLKRKRGC